MGKRLLEWWRWLKEWMREKAMSAFLSALVLLVCTGVVVAVLGVVVVMGRMFGRHDRIATPVITIYKRF